MVGWSAAHRKTAVFGWLLLVAAIFMLGQALGSRQLPQYSAGQAGQAERVLNQYAPAQLNASTENVLIQAKAPGATFATDPAMRQAASQVAASLAAMPQYAAHIQALRVSKDSRSALVTFQVPGNLTSIGQAVSSLQHAVAGVQARQPDLRVAETGDASIQQAINDSLNFGKAEVTSVPITLILMLAVFGSLVAVGIPVLLALTALTAAIGVVTGLSHVLPVSGNTFEVVVVVGMAVGVDYSLFYLRREREERARGGRRPDPVPRPQAGRRPAVPDVGGAGPQGGRQAGDLGRPRHGRAARAGRAGARPAARPTLLVPAALALLGDHAWQRRRNQAVKGGDSALVAAHP